MKPYGRAQTGNGTRLAVPKSGRELRGRITKHAAIGTDAPRINESQSPFSLIESVLSPSGVPVLGLHLHVAHKQLLQSFTQKLGQHEITPNSVGVLALVDCYPGISQIALAKLLRLERASAGDRVARCIATGVIKRIDSPDDKRRYALYITARGRRILQRLREQIPDHEDAFASHLTIDERTTLIRLLDKLVPAWAGPTAG